MPHVFISYARPDEPVACLIAERLREAGFEVWRDDELPAHRSYAEVIEARIKGASAVVTPVILVLQFISSLGYSYVDATVFDEETLSFSPVQKEEDDEDPFPDGINFEDLIK